MTGKQIASKQEESLTRGERNGSLRHATHINWKYMLAYGLLFLINILPLITEKPYLPQDTQEAVPDVMTRSTWSLWRLYHHDPNPIKMPGNRPRIRLLAVRHPGDFFLNLRNLVLR